MSVPVAILATILIVSSVACDVRARRHYDHGQTHELAARSNPDQIAAVAADLVCATKAYRASRDWQLWAYGLLCAATGVMVAGGGL